MTTRARGAPRRTPAESPRRPDPRPGRRRARLSPGRALALLLGAAALLGGSPALAHKMGSPSNLAAFAENQAVELVWSATDAGHAPAVVRYAVQYRTTVVETPNDDTPTTVTGITGTFREVTGLTNGTSYQFRMQARHATDSTTHPNSDWTDWVEATPNVPPDAPVVTVTPGDAKLTLTWQTPSWGAYPAAGYLISVRDQAAVGSGYSPLRAIGRNLLPATATSFVLSGSFLESNVEYTVTNGHTYDVLLRAVSRRSDAPEDTTDESYFLFSDRVELSGTPGKYFGFSPASFTVRKGVSVRPWLVLNEPAPSPDGLTFTLAALFGNAVPEFEYEDPDDPGMMITASHCGGNARTAVAADLGAGPPATVTVPAGETRVAFEYPTVIQDDDRVGMANECLAVRAATAAAGWEPGDGTSVRGTQIPGAGDVSVVTLDRSVGYVGFGERLENEINAHYRATVLEDAGTLKVPVSVHMLPNVETRFDVEVVAAGTTATEYVDAMNPGDFRIETKSVTFRPADTTKTQYVTVAITSDAVGEAEETIQLKLSAGGGSGVNSSYTRVPYNNPVATLTIEDLPPPVLSVVARSASAHASTHDVNASWTRPRDDVTGYDVQIKESAAPDAVTGNSATGWAGTSDQGTSLTFSVTKAGTAYDVRVRAKYGAAGDSAWTRTSVTVRPNAPADLRAGRDHRQLNLTWSAPPHTGTVSGYEVHYTASSTVADDATAGSDPAADWVDAGTGTVREKSIPNLSNDTEYRVRVRTAAAGVDGPWAHAKGTPRVLLGWEKFDDGVAEGESKEYAVRLSEALAADTTFEVGFDATSSTATETADFVVRTRTVTVPAGRARAVVRLSAVADHRTEAADEVAVLVLVAPPGAPYALDPERSSQTGTTYHERLTVLIRDDSQDPGPPEGLAVASGNGLVDLRWAPTPGGAAGYDVEYRQWGTGAFKDAHHVGTAREHRIRGLTNGRGYEVRVRWTRSASQSLWALGGGIPTTQALTLRADRTPAEGGAEVTVTATLAEPAGGDKILRVAFTGTAEGGFREAGGVDYVPSASGGSISRADGVLTALMTIGAGRRTATFEIAVADDEVDDDDETIVLGASMDGDAVGPGVAADVDLEPPLSATLTLTVVDDDGGPGAPTDLAVTTGNARLDLRWAAPSGTVTGYDVHYTSAGAGAVADGATVQTGDSASPASGWVDAGHAGTATAQAIPGLANGTAYRVRVRAVNAVSPGAWTHGTGTPVAINLPPDAPPPPPPPSTDASLSTLEAAGAQGSPLALRPAFAPETTAYTVAVPYAVAGVRLAPAAGDEGATVTVNGVEVAPGEASAAIALAVGETLIEVVVTAPGGASGTYRVTVTRAPAGLALLPAASGALQGFVRLVNASGEAGTVTVRAFDDAGAEYGPLTLALGAGEVRHFNSGDLERGNPAKGLDGSMGAPRSGRWWRLVFESALGIRALGYLRTADGFVTSMHEAVTERQSQDGYRYAVAFFNPASNTRQVSRLRLVNRSDAQAAVTITGRDDTGRAGEEAVTLTLPAGAARMLSAPDLESGAEDFDGALGDGRGKWRLVVHSDQPLTVMSLLASPTGHLTNLSAAPPGAGPDGVHRLWLLPAAASNALQGFVRVVNTSDAAGTVRIRAFDDAGEEYAPVTLALGAGAVRHFNSGDLERGNPAKGLTGATGAPRSGRWWRLVFESALGIRAPGYLRTRDGFVTSMHETVTERPAEDGYRYAVAFFNPASNTRQVSRLRLVNRAEAQAAVTITGLDDSGRAGEGAVTLTLPAGAARMLSALDLESGAEDSEGALGDGRGKWRLVVRSDRPLTVMSLLQSPTGHLTNLSPAPPPRAEAARGLSRPGRRTGRGAGPAPKGEASEAKRAPQADGA